MKFSLEFLNQYLPAPQSFEAISEALVRLGFEIDGTEPRGYCGSGSLVVGQVKTKVPHPNSDHLSVCTVDVGQTEPLQILCGASNFKVGDKVKLIPRIIEIRDQFLEGILTKKKSDGLLLVEANNRTYKLKNGLSDLYYIEKHN